jgi:hypothetical protein
MISSPAGTSGDLIEEYLDRLLVSLSGSPRQVRHTLAEVEAHLRDAVAEGVAAGLPEEQAQEQALERIGPVHVVAGRPGVITRPSAALLRRLVLTAALVGGAALTAIGVAGLIGRGLQAVKGNLFMTAPWPAGTYTQADCARWLANDPGTHSCVTAMLADHAWDFQWETAGAGLLGVIAPPRRCCQRVRQKASVLRWQAWPRSSSLARWSTSRRYSTASAQVSR